MPDKKLLVIGRTVNNPEAKVTLKRKVIFHPQDSTHAVTIRFVERVPFSNWDCATKTGAIGKPLEGKVRKDAMNDYPYEAFSNPMSKGARPLGNPKLIVDGGGIVPPVPPGRRKRN